MNVRVTGFGQSQTAIANMQKQSAAVARYQAQLSSGSRIELPSDDPGGYTVVARQQAASKRLDAYTGNMASAASTLNAGVSALQDANDVLVRASQIASEAASGGTTATGVAALANEVDSLVDRMMTAANAQTDGQYLFGGTATDSPPFRAAGVDGAGRPAAVAYAGAAERARALIGQGHTTDSRFTGDAVFQKTGADVFQNLLGLRDELRDPALTIEQRTTALTNRLGGLSSAREAVADATAEQASTLATLDALQTRAGDLKLAADARAGEVGGTDYAEAIVKMQEQQTSLQATMAVAAKLLQPSLLDFIR